MPESSGTARREEVGYRTLRLCSGGGGYEALPVGRAQLDLRRLRGALERAGIPSIDARVMLIVSLGPEVTVAASGRILIKTGDAGVAGLAFAKIRELITESGGSAPRERTG